MICPKCTHQVGVLESFKIVNPFDFPCPACAVRLSVGPRGKVIALVAALFGAALGLYGSYLWVVRRMSFADSFGWIPLLFGALALPWQWAAIRFSDVKLRSDARAG